MIYFFRSGNVEEFNSYELLKNLEQHVSINLVILAHGVGKYLN